DNLVSLCPCCREAAGCSGLLEFIARSPELRFLDPATGWRERVLAGGRRSGAHTVADRSEFHGGNCALQHSQASAIGQAEIYRKVAVGLTHAVWLSLHSGFSCTGGTTEYELRSHQTACGHSRRTGISSESLRRQRSCTKTWH